MANKKQSIPFIGGNVKGHFSNKWNRAAKLNTMLPDLEKKLEGIMMRGAESVSENYRCAVALQVMMYTGIRVGNERSAEGYVSLKKETKGKEVSTFGLTTLQPRHYRRGKFYFAGKREVAQVIQVPKHLQQHVERCKDYAESKELFGVTLYQFTKFVKTYVGRNFMPKDFRTVVACRLAASEVAQLRPWQSKSERKKQIKGICEVVAQQLGNTPAMAKRAYINPEILAL